MKIKEVCHGGRTILLHAKRKWPSVISTVLWPYAVQAIVERHNRLALDKNGKSPLEKFSGIKDEITPTNIHTWGCPVFILEEANQSRGIGITKVGTKITYWDLRGTFALPCRISCISIEPIFRPGEPTISRSF